MRVGDFTAAESKLIDTEVAKMSTNNGKLDITNLPKKTTSGKKVTWS